MGSRKESIKKTLGISEYPWSSDDEDELPVQMVRAQMNGTDVRGGGGDPNTPGPSGSGAASNPPTSSRRDSGFWSLSLNPPRLSDSGGSLSVRRPSEMGMGYIPRSGSNERTGAQDVQRVLAFRSLRRQAVPSNVIYRPSYSSGLTRAASTSHLMRDSEQNMIAEMAARMREAVSPAQGEVPVLRQSAAANNGYLDNPMQTNSVPAQSSRDRDDRDDRDERDEMTMDPDTEEAIAEEEPDGGGAPQETSAMSLEEEVVEIDGDAEPEPQPDAENQQDSQEPPLEDIKWVVEMLGAADAEQQPPPAQDSANDVSSEEPIPTTSSASEPPAQPPQPHGVKRKRESDEDTSEMGSVKDFNQSLLRLLECPVCLEWMEPPMWQCRRGHLVCGRCRARLQACPVCRTAFSSVRNRAMEGVAEMIRYPCRHGCGRDLQLRRRGTHEASCAARRYPCPAPACDQRPPLAHPDLTAHIHSKHLSMVKVGRRHKFSMKVNSEQHDNWIISALHQLFHLRVDVDIRTWGVVVYVAYIGPKCNADDYTYEVTVIGQHNSRKLVYTRATHCDLECSTLNVSRQDCFHLTLDQALNFLRVKNRHCEPDKYLNFNVEISSNTNQEDSDS